MKVAVIGLGTFGTAVVQYLHSRGVEVLAIDENMDDINEAKEYSTTAVRFDATNMTMLKRFRLDTYDVAVVAIGEKFEDNVLVVSALKEIGVPRVITKTASLRMKDILYKVGADEVYIPEKEFGETLAKKILQRKALDLIPISDKFAMAELKTPKIFTVKPLKDLAIRKKYGVTIVVVRKKEKHVPESTDDAKVDLNEYSIVEMATADTVLEGNEILIVMGPNEKLEELSRHLEIHEE
ncbi:MAG: TrkA family potassium uptake protein [Candidatus Hydrogenedentota bacterium]|nr:MAG: TrkA family potassium uptake protein [Candidatus Hydrogenedentota bacterium]